MLVPNGHPEEIAIPPPKVAEENLEQRDPMNPSLHTISMDPEIAAILPDIPVGAFEMIRTILHK